MVEQAKCPQCGKAVPSDTPQGLCPACLLKRGLETNTIGDTGGASGARWTPPTVEALAPLFPELDIIELIGRGGMGAVYKAREKQLDRLVALKILPPEIGREDSLAKSFAQRFAREAQAMAKLSHPNIVTIHSFGSRVIATGGSTEPTAGGDLYFFIMEYVDGLSLRQLLDAGTVNPKEALAIVPQICDALQYAHDRGIVHRDIKPENILLSRAGLVKIADFGLAKLVGSGISGTGVPAVEETTHGQDAHATHGQDARATHGRDAHATREVMGTPQYMAPEQIDRPGEVDHRADIYSLGVVFYQMLTGELPVGRFEPPSRKVLIDVRLDEVVLRALEREPSRRYQQVSEVKTQVETIAATELRVPRDHEQATETERHPSKMTGRATVPGRNIHNLKLRLIIIPVLIIVAAFLVMFLGGGLPWREVPFIWLPWLGIMLAVAAAGFTGFLVVGWSRSTLLQVGAAVGFLCLGLFGAYDVLGHPGGDPLARVPVAIQSVFFIIYAVLLATLAVFSIGAAKAIADTARFEAIDHARHAAIPPIRHNAIWGSLILRVGIHLTALIGTLVFFTMVVPRYEKVFRDLGAALPLLTRLVISTSDLLVEFGIVFVPAAIVFLAADAGIMWLLHRAGQHLLTWIWSVLVLLGLGAALALGIGGLAAPMRQIMTATTVAPTTQTGGQPGSQPARYDAFHMTQPPQLRFLAWQNENADPAHRMAWRPDGDMVDYQPELALLQSVSPVACNAGPARTGSEPLFLYLWFQHPLFDRQSLNQVTLLDSAGREIPSGAGGMQAGNAGQETKENDCRWLTDTLSPGDMDHFPPAVTIRLRYTFGPWENSQAFAPNKRGPIPLGNGSQFNGIGQDARGKAFFAIAVDKKLDPNRQFGVVAVTRDGRELLPSDGYRGGGVGQAVHTQQFSFDTQLANIAHFRLGTRPIKTIEFKDVRLRMGIVKVFHSAVEVLAGLPADARPSPRDGWDEFSHPKADKWLTDNISKHGYDIVLRAVLKDVKLDRISPYGQLNETIRWDVALNLERTAFEFNGGKITLKLNSYTPWNPNAAKMPLHLMDAVVTISGDENLARRAKNLQAGEAVTIRGTISQVAVWENRPPELWILLSRPSAAFAGEQKSPSGSKGEQSSTQAESQPATQLADAWRVKLPNGAEVELLGLCANPRKAQPATQPATSSAKGKDPEVVRELALSVLRAIKEDDLATLKSLSAGSRQGWLNVDWMTLRTVQQGKIKFAGEPPVGWSESDLKSVSAEIRRDVLLRNPDAATKVLQTLVQDDWAATLSPVTASQYLVMVLVRTDGGWRFATLDESKGNLADDLAKHMANIPKNLKVLRQLDHSSASQTATSTNSGPAAGPNRGAPMSQPSTFPATGPATQPATNGASTQPATQPATGPAVRDAWSPPTGPASTRSAPTTQPAARLQAWRDEESETLRALSSEELVRRFGTAQSHAITEPPGKFSDKWAFIDGRIPDAGSAKSAIVGHFHEDLRPGLTLIIRAHVK